jgi:hypothetical protein
LPYEVTAAAAAAAAAAVSVFVQRDLGTHPLIPQWQGTSKIPVHPVVITQHPGFAGC